MDNPVIYMILLGLLVLLAMVFGGLSVKTWRWPDVLAGFLVFVMAITFLILLSLSMKARRHWLREVATQEARNERASEEQQRLLYGDLTETGQTDTFTTLSAKLSRFLLDRGRVWRDCVPAANPDETFTITIPGADAANPHQIPPRFILYLFREKVLEGIVVPATYIGEFEVTVVTETGVQVRPTYYAPDLRKIRDANPEGFLSSFVEHYVQGHTWSMYETLPVDDHELYSNPDVQPDLAQAGQPAFGPVDEAEVRRIVSAMASFASAEPIDEAKQQAIVQRYVRDGQRANPMTDPPGDVYTKVRFVKPYTEKVDTDVIAGGTANVDFFDTQGQAQLDYLGVEEGDSVTLPVGAVILLPKEEANVLIRDGVCEPIEDVYVRNLTDYATLFRYAHDRVLELRTKRFFIDRNIELVQKTAAYLSQMLQIRQTERNKLESDLQKVTYEHQQMQSLAQEVDTQLNTLKENIRELLASCLALEQQLESIQRLISENVERNVEQAVATP